MTPRGIAHRIARMIRKVIAYITRHRADIAQLLIFEHVDFPQAGVQVPKGTVETDETLDHAARREVREESGLTQLDGLKFIGAIMQTTFGESEEWNFFAQSLDGDAPDTWVHHVTGKGEDEGMRFRYYWIPLSGQTELAGGQHAGLRFL